jgi:hypothetical protein
MDEEVQEIMTRAALFAQLAGLGVVEVWVEFNGSDDSGQIEGIYAAKRTQRDMRGLNHNDPARTTAEVTLPEDLGKAIEEQCYAYLEETQRDWYHNDGGQGEFMFDVPAKKISLHLEINETTHNDYDYVVDGIEGELRQTNGDEPEEAP